MQDWPFGLRTLAFEFEYLAPLPARAPRWVRVWRTIGFRFVKMLNELVSLPPCQARKLDAISEFERKSADATRRRCPPGRVDKCAICRIRFAGTLGAT